MRVRGAPVEQTCVLRPQACAAQWVLTATSPQAPGHMCRYTCYTMEGEYTHGPRAFRLEAKQIYTGSFVSCGKPLLPGLAHPTSQVP